MSTKLMKAAFVAALLAGTALTATSAQASHFRGAALVPTVDASGLLTVTQTSFWRKGVAASVPNVVSGVGTMTTVSNILDTTDSRYDRRVIVSTIQLSGAGTYDIRANSCCRISGIRNRTGGSPGSTSVAWQMDSRIVWDGSTANTPILFDFATVQSEVLRGTQYNQNLNVVSGQTLTYNNALNTNGGGAGTFNQTPGFTIDPNTGQMTITAASTATLLDNDAGNAGGDYFFSGNIMAADGSFVEYDWLWDAVNTSSNSAPVVNDIVLNGLVGDTISHTMIGADPEGGALTWDLISFLGIGGNGLESFNPGSQLFDWNTVGSAPGTYIANIRATDPLGLSDVGTITINLTAGTPPPPGSNVPEPTSLTLLGMGLAGLGFGLRRRRRQMADK